MSKDCLVTRLKATVSGDMPYFGTIKLETKENASATATNIRVICQMQSGTEGKVFSVPDGLLTLNGAPVNNVTIDENSKTFSINSANGFVYISDNYKIDKLSLYCSRIKQIDWDSIAGRSMTSFYLGLYSNPEDDNLADVIDRVDANNSLTSLTFSSSSYDGTTVSDINTAIASHQNITTFIVFSSEIAGTLSDLKAVTGLTLLEFNNPRITGTVEDFLAYQALHRGAGSLECVFGQSVTFHGVADPPRYFVTFDGSNGCVVKKSGNVTVGTFNGTTWTY